MYLNTVHQYKLNNCLSLHAVLQKIITPQYPLLQIRQLLIYVMLRFNTTVDQTQTNHAHKCDVFIMKYFKTSPYRLFSSYQHFQFRIKSLDGSLVLGARLVTANLQNLHYCVATEVEQVLFVLCLLQLREGANTEVILLE